MENAEEDEFLKPVEIFYENCHIYRHGKSSWNKLRLISMSFHDKIFEYCLLVSAIYYVIQLQHHEILNFEIAVDA